MTDYGELIAEAELGDAAKKFIESDLGKCLVGMAAQEVMSAEKALGKIDPKDESGIVKLQNSVWLGEHFQQWLVELIDNGESAIEVFKQGNQK